MAGDEEDSPNPLSPGVAGNGWQTPEKGNELVFSSPSSLPSPQGEGEWYARLFAILDGLTLMDVPLGLPKGNNIFDTPSMKSAFLGAEPKIFTLLEIMKEFVLWSIIDIPKHIDEQIKYFSSKPPTHILNKADKRGLAHLTTHKYKDHNHNTYNNFPATLHGFFP